MNRLAKNLKKDEIETMANSYLRTPRAIADGMYSPDLPTRQINTTLHALLVMSSHSGRVMKCKREKIYCSKGELYTDTATLALLTNIEKWTIRRLLHKLLADGFIDIQYWKRGLLIRVIHYEEFTSGRKNRKNQPEAPSSLTMEGKTPEQVAYEQAILEKRRQEFIPPTP